jgi:hypothetical protein
MMDALGPPCLRSGVRCRPKLMIKSGTVAAILMAFLAALVALSYVPHGSDSLGIAKALMPLIFVILCFLSFCIAWAPCLLVAILWRWKETPTADVERAWNVFTASLLPLAVGLCMLLGTLLNKHPTH